MMHLKTAVPPIIIKYFHIRLFGPNNSEERDEKREND
jgi:hypothetical protein